jgi:L-rhamnose mutarotase
MFAYYEYAGDNFAADMAKMASDPTTQKWLDLVQPMMSPLADRKENEVWAGMEEVFHLD